MKVSYECDYTSFEHCKGVDIVVKHFTKFAVVASKIIDDSNMELLVTQYEGNQYEFSLSCGKKLSMIRVVNLRTGHYEHDTFSLGEEFQGRGLVKHMFRCTIDICEALGITKVVTSAILDGRIVWLKRGFVPFCCETYFKRLENLGVRVPVCERNEYWFNQENLKKYEREVAEISWHGYAMVETLKQYA
ncbi:hypothetical protein ASswx1_308 [Aeromonas phage Asswx_1]|uniref:Uncharacterized protein n=1 Tax=Aeromonas phage Asswx_1 TaxID=2419739 RepID=A0A411B8P8_9CAUD|nr:hypothetical protein ASswx1_308 [Aeromonas phage Asswx_1]